MTFRARIHRTDPQNTGGQFETLLRLFQDHFFVRDRSLGAPLLALAKFIYYFPLEGKETFPIVICYSEIIERTKRVSKQ